MHAGETPNSQEFGANTYLKDVCNLYLEHQHSRIQAGEIKLRQVYDQTALLKDFVQHMGTSRRLSEINTIGLQVYRRRLIKQGKAATRKITHARILLQANESQDGPAWTDEQISEAFVIHANTIHGIRRRFVEAFSFSEVVVVNSRKWGHFPASSVGTHWPDIPLGLV